MSHFHATTPNIPSLLGSFRLGLVWLSVIVIFRVWPQRQCNAVSIPIVLQIADMLNEINKVMEQ